MNIQIVDMELMTLAFSTDRDEATAIAKLDAFLAANGVTPEHLYQNELSFKKGEKRTCVYIKYAPVPRGTVKTNDVNVSDIPSGPALSFRVSEAQYIQLMDGEFRSELEIFLKQNGLWWDLRRMMALAEAKLVEGKIAFDILFPVKHK